jgi:hypothetical protein
MMRKDATPRTSLAEVKGQHACPCKEARAIISGGKDRITMKLEEKRLLNPFEIHHT